VTFNRGLTLAQQMYGDVHEEVALFLENIGAVYGTECKEARAIEIFQRVLDIYHTIREDDCAEVACINYNLCSLHTKLCNYDIAMDAAMKALRGARKANNEEFVANIQVTIVFSVTHLLLLNNRAKS
jgi:tetratricopeptide (TPR) repeat protein